jgi:hypothetical protein
MSIEGALRAAGIEITPAGDDDDLWHDAAVPGHIREAATLGEYLDKPRPGVILADCSCGAEYEVPQGGDEYGALEKAHHKHVATAVSGNEKAEILTEATEPAIRIWFERNTGARIYLRPASGGGTGWTVRLASTALPPNDDYLRESYHSDTLFALQEVAARMDKVPGDWVKVP